MQQTDFAKRFTDIEYLSKKEIGERVSIEMMDSIWKLTNDYREKYRFAIELKRTDRLPFSIVLTPAIMSLANSAERLMFQYAQTFQKFTIYQTLSDHKVLTEMKEKMMVDDLMLFAHSYGISASAIEVVDLVKGKETRLKKSPVEGLLKAIDYLISSPNVKFDQYLLKKIFIALNHLETNLDALMYRDTEIGSIGYSSIGAAPSRIPDHMKMLFDFIDADYEMSPFIIGAIVFAYFNYIVPFQTASNEVAVLLLQKIIADAGYGEAGYYTSIMQYFLQNADETISIINEVRKTGDLTYAITYVSKMFIDALSFSIKSISKLVLPKVLGGEVKIVEKIVEVPVEIIREVIKEVPVEVEKKIYIKEDIKSPAKSESVNVEKIRVPNIIEEEKVEDFQEPKKNNRVFSFDNDPFLQNQLRSSEDVKRVENVEKQVQKESTNISKPKPEVVQPIEEVQVEQIKPEQLANLNALDVETYAYQLVQLNPNIRLQQAQFYANHRVFGRFYTISQFKQFNDCAYETARTSMDFLTSVGLYSKKQLKNKFVYTPNYQQSGE